LFFQSCDPIPLNTVDDDPEFTIDFTIDGQAYSFNAGVDDYFMQTEIINLAPTRYFGSLLRKIDDQLIDNELALTISFQEGEEVNNSTDPDHINSFKTGIIPFNTLDDAALPIKEVLFNGGYAGTGSDVIYEWDYGDGISSEYKDPIHAYSEIGLYTATLKIADDNQCAASATNTVSFDNRGDCVSSIAITNVSSTGAILESSSTGVGPFQYNWTNGSTESDLSIDISDASGTQEHCVTITDSNNCESVNCVGIIKDAAGVINTCSAMMSESNYLRARRAKQFNSVEISWVNENGDEYSSRDVLQDSDSVFEIISFEEYDMNAQGERTVKIEFEFSCKLYLTGGTDPITVSNAKGVIAVAIP